MSDQTGKDAPIERPNLASVSQEPSSLPPGFEWCTVDMENEEEMVNLAKFLKDNYVEDRDGLMRMEYPL